MTHPNLPPPSPREAPSRGRTIGTCLVDLEDAILEVRRAHAGYTHLAEYLVQIKNPPRPGERRKGAPLFTTKAPCETAEGLKTIEVHLTVDQIDQNYVEHVLTPMANAHARIVSLAVARVKCLAEEMTALSQSAAIQSTAEPQ